MDKVVYKELSYKINGLLFKVHKELGCYRNEKQYGDYFENLLIKDEVKYVREYRFEDHQYSQGKVRCICDFIIEDKISNSEKCSVCKKNNVDKEVSNNMCAKCENESYDYGGGREE